MLGELVLLDATGQRPDLLLGLTGVTLLPLGAALDIRFLPSSHIVATREGRLLVLQHAHRLVNVIEGLFLADATYRLWLDVSI